MGRMPWYTMVFFIDLIKPAREERLSDIDIFLGFIRPYIVQSNKGRRECNSSGTFTLQGWGGMMMKH